jgi:hypothetical protein
MNSLPPIIEARRAAFEPFRKAIASNLSHVQTFTKAFQLLKQDYFPRYTPVYVRYASYTGFGIVWNTLPESNLESIGVRLENGNIWHYPCDSMVPVEWSYVPKSLRIAYLAWRGIRGIHTYGYPLNLP